MSDSFRAMAIELDAVRHKQEIAAAFSNLRLKYAGADPCRDHGKIPERLTIQVIPLGGFYCGPGWNCPQPWMCPQSPYCHGSMAQDSNESWWCSAVAGML